MLHLKSRNFNLKLYETELKNKLQAEDQKSEKRGEKGPIRR